MKGIIIKSTGSWYDVFSEDKIYKSRLRGKFKIQGIKATNPIAVGDKVEFELDKDDIGSITGLLGRENFIVRKSVHKTSQSHIIASNLDQTILIATLVMPRTSLGFIDRFLVSAESFRIPTVIVFNKSDLLDEEGKSIQKELIGLYEKLGYPCIVTSAKTLENLEEVSKTIAGKTTLFSGHSGVGKSTLLNTLYPELSQKTAEVSTFANKGVHTTTFAEMFILPNKTYIIDTPGIKELGIVDIPEEELSHYFPEMRDLPNECKYYNCTHTHEPGCAVIQGVKEGKIAPSRYMSYISIFENKDNRK